MTETRTFVIVNPDGTESGTFKGKSPRPAAIKAVKTLTGTKEKPATFKLREKGAHTIHIFSGYTEMVKAPEKRPAWMKEMIKAAHVGKVGIEKEG